MSVLEKLTEGIVDRDLQKEGAALLNKWEATGLLEGIESDSKRSGMARLLENQAKQLLKEASGMAAGDVEGFAAVAFPIVRRVFGGLLANDLVSVQPMSLPSGLIFFLDFTSTHTRVGSDANDSLYGGGAVGQAIKDGVSLTGDNAEESFYALNHGYSSPTGTIGGVTAAATLQVFASGTFGGTGSTIQAGEVSAGADAQKAFDALCRFDPDFEAGTTSVLFYKVGVGAFNQLNSGSLISITRIGSGSAAEISGSQVRRLTQWSGSNKGRYQAGDTKSHLLLAYASVDGTLSPKDLINKTGDGVGIALESGPGGDGHGFEWSTADNFGGTPAAGTAGALGAVVGADAWGLEEATNSAGTVTGGASSEAKNVIPEIDIKVDSISVTAVTKKLKAKWTPELGQDLNAYHNLDAEVELTGILSEQIALEIDREILEDLVQYATAGTYYWSRSPGLFVNRTTGVELGAASAAPDFTGTVSEWYETLAETINDVSAQIHRKVLRGGATFIVVSPEVANILEFTSGFRASVTHDDDRGTVGAVKVGSMSKKWDVYVDPYFPRNLCLVGRNGGSFLETGYVYAPYVPLQVTPTIFGTEDFVPRKGVMTRYAKKMVRPDMYGLVVVRGLLGEAGATS